MGESWECEKTKGSPIAHLFTGLDRHQAIFIGSSQDVGQADAVVWPRYLWQQLSRVKTNVKRDPIDPIELNGRIRLLLKWNVMLDTPMRWELSEGIQYYGEFRTLKLLRESKDMNESGYLMEGKNKEKLKWKGEIKEHELQRCRGRCFQQTKFHGERQNRAEEEIARAIEQSNNTNGQ
uniref:Uncharacterized protein n=1 Tax=Vespula pensylvanica TaxID=30213 RepID=A0A834P5B4_VESPE|nr:hypothetical protein H0235_005656 [Vespula pensylvanica]